ncbi:hypothetical protein MSM1_16900 [Mycobacterium sp. SM1]|uniref:hypothetical protein n=1 Tax=Mycobacterium sp. SM1 TaxID=2816243 RepID=UPI001BCFB00E|nr:hypothetical protein [Mycobacterium sp. SM1]MBS4729947.1 hypothetical protein [Mycobacterium sp. SM1]
MSVGLIAAAAVWAAPVQADPTNDSRQSVCPMMTQVGSSFASLMSTLINATSDIHGKTTINPDMAGMFSKMGISNYCPDAERSLRNNQLPNVPGIISDRPDVHGIVGGVPSSPGAPSQ